VIALAAYGIIHLFIARVVGSPDYRVAVLWWAVFGLALFVQQLGVWVGVGIIFAVILPVTRKRIRGYWKSFKHST
jgi:PST family polysaccharide transporter